MKLSILTAVGFTLLNWNLVLADENQFKLVESPTFPELKILSDLEIDLIGKDPQIANPLYLNFDERGRMWVVQYRQYPWPAGLKLLSRDRVWRNIYEPPFAPPPPHDSNSPFRGRDRITIHEDTNGDGSYDKETLFLDGLNFATAALKGDGGVFVMNPPYLLFYSDRDHDDVPDSQTPKVLLSGFGIEDSHSVANSLRWGPDGWIYATQGSTVSASIVRHGTDGLPLPNEKPIFTMGQNVWRYHPQKHIYEVFGEGGGNSFGIEFDSKGRVFSGHNGGDTRGFHYVQGGYWRKNFGKHGDLSNPYAFDHFEAMAHHSVNRFTHTFTFYDAGLLPQRYHGKLFGVNPVGHNVVHSQVFANGSSRKTADLSFVIEPGSGERASWFTPVDIQTGPDGALYVADWYSVQSNHYKNHEGQTNPDLGRIYRIRPHDFVPIKPFDLNKSSSLQLVRKFLQHPERWYRQQALRILDERQDQSIVAELNSILFSDANHNGDGHPYSLEAFWALNLCGEFNNQLAAKTLQHTNPFVRLWAVRLLGDTKQAIAKPLANRLLEMARTEKDVEVVCQLTSTAMRLPPGQALPLIQQLALRNDFETDIYIPKMVWWALESQADEMGAVDLFQNQQLWQSKMLAGNARLHENLMRRYAMRGAQIDFLGCARLCELAPGQQELSELIRGFARALEGRPMPAIPKQLSSAIARAGGDYAILLGVRDLSNDSIAQALEIVSDHSKETLVRHQLIQALGDVRAVPTSTIPALLSLAVNAKTTATRNVALASLQKFDRPGIADSVLEVYRALPKDCHISAQSLLASRPVWASQMLQAVEQKKIAASELDSETVERLRLHRDSTLREKVARLFPQHKSTPAELDSQIEQIAATVISERGNPAEGRKIFHGKALCGKCHELFGQGQNIGPDLTSYNRNDIRRMLLSIVNPSAEVREGYENFTAVTEDGRVVTGLKIEETSDLLVLRGTDGQNQSLSKAQIDDSFQNKRSIMPVGLLDNLSDSELRDLFAFLVSTTPPM